MNAEQVLSMSEDDMVSANRVQSWMVGLALLAGGEFSYAHLRRLGFWPLEVVARSAWRLITVLDAAILPGGVLWAGPLALGIILVLAWALAAWRGQRRAGAASEVRHHE